jgi:hypothetical protein
LAKIGRPTKYKPEYCKQLIDFFNRPLTIKGFEGKQYGNTLPTFERFAADINVNMSSLTEWRNKHEDFSTAYKICKLIQKDFLIQNGLTGRYNSTFGIFVAKNITDMRDQHQIEIDDIAISREERDQEIKDLLSKIGDDK